MCGGQHAGKKGLRCCSYGCTNQLAPWKQQPRVCLLQRAAKLAAVQPCVVGTRSTSPAAPVQRSLESPSNSTYDQPFFVVVPYLSLLSNRLCRYGQVLRANPACPAEVRLGIAACYYRAGKLEAATAAYNRVLALDPSSADALLGLAVIKFGSSNVQEVRNVCCRG